MITLQSILVYCTLVLAVGFLIRKYFFSKKKSAKACGKDDCGCH